MTVESMVPAMLTIIKEWVCLSLPVSHSIALEFHSTVSLLLHSLRVLHIA